MTGENLKYAEVILPLKLKMEVSYTIPENLEPEIMIGSRVRVEMGGREYIAVVRNISSSCGEYAGKIKEVTGVEPAPAITEKEFEFWEWMASYYMCTIGEVYRAAFTSSITEQEHKKARNRSLKVKAGEEFSKLSSAQEKAFEEIKLSFSKGVPALLEGITGSGKTEIYIRLAKEEIDKGRCVLYLVPEIALSRQLSERLNAVFGERLLIFHSKQSPAERFRAHKALRESGDGKGYIVLGLRSSVFLPFRELGLIIIDEEHDSSYKQTDPAPRYNGRDCAMMLGKIHSAPVVLGSATPSLESQFNVASGRYSGILLKERFYGAETPEIVVLDTIRESKRGKMNGLFSQQLIKEIENTLLKGEQVLIFRNRRSYSPLVQCTNCGHIPLCTHCNVPLNYHKGKGILLCHYCDFRIRYSQVCPACQEATLEDKGSGTEKIEEKIKEIFPFATVARFDAEVTKSKREESRILKEYAAGKIDILVGTQMISKGFDFENLSLVALIQADSMLALDDFRANERAFQLLTQLSGRTGRKHVRGKIIIQSAQPKHPVYHLFETGSDTVYDQLSERKEFDYPPYVRMIKITLKDRNRERLSVYASQLGDILGRIRNIECSGPFAPLTDKIRGEFLLVFWIKFSRNSVSAIKTGLKELLISFESGKSSLTVATDVDPV